MIEAILIDYLGNALDVPVYVMLPDEIPAGAFLVLDRTATDKTNHVVGYDMAVQSYGDTALAAATLNEQVISAMDDLITLDSIASCRLNTSYMFTDITRKRPRYQATFSIVML